MKFFLSSANIPELDQYTSRERLIIVSLASQKLTIWQKFTINIVRLLILTPLFIAVAKADGWNMAYFIIPALLIYPLISRPVTLAMCYPHLDYGIKELEKFKQSN